MNSENVSGIVSTSPGPGTPWKSTRSQTQPRTLARGRGAARFTIGTTHAWHAKHLALIGNGHALRRSLCGYSVVPHPDGEASMTEWDAQCCPQCAGIASALARG